jgi:diguanylate cyclase (GGDEF)-like protein
MREKQLARVDAFTNIPNRLTFIEWLNSCFYLAVRSKAPFSLAYIDIDDFKYINDSYGHDSGDNILRSLADLLCTHLRRTDMAARLGGDEFALLLPNTGSEGAHSLIDKIQSSIRETFQSEPLTVAASMGVVNFESLPKTPDDAIKRADALMYKVKQGGKNSVRFDSYK